MSRRIHTIEFIDSFPCFCIRETSIFTPKTMTPLFCVDPHNLSLSLDSFTSPSLIGLPSYEIFDSMTDLVHLSNRVSAIEETFERLEISRGKCKWTAEIKGGSRKCKWTAVINDLNQPHCYGKRNYKWSREVKGKKDRKKEVIEVEVKERNKKKPHCLKSGGFLRLGDLSADSSEWEKERKIKKKERKERKKEKGGVTRVVEIEESLDHAALLLQQAYSRRAGATKRLRGKKKDLSPQDAALIIQQAFRAYLIHRSKALRAFRDLAVAKTKLKEIRASFNNFSYRRNIARNAEERQRFSEKIIVLLLTVDSIEGVDVMVRGAKRSMVDELEAMLDVVDPRPEKSRSMKRRAFDMPDGLIQSEVAKVVEALGKEGNESSSSSSS